MHTASSNVYNPNFTGLKVDGRIPAKIRKAIKTNPTVQYGAQKFNLKFGLIPTDEQKKSGIIYCDIPQIKKSRWDYLIPFKSLFDGCEIYLGSTKQGCFGVLRFLKRISSFTSTFIED